MTPLETTDPPVRVEFVGGPLCGVVWWPWTNSIASNWNHEVNAQAEDCAHDELTPGNVPQFVHVLDEGMICVHYADEEWLYLWRDGDRYDHEPWDLVAFQTDVL